MPIRSSWPYIQYTRGKVTPHKRRKIIINQIETEKAAQERRGIAAELIAKEKEEIRQAREAREKVMREREAITRAAKEYPNEPLKIQRDKKGNISLARPRKGGKFQPKIRVEIG